MPNVTVKIPLSDSPLTFATRARRRAGLGMFLAPGVDSNFPAGPRFSRGGMGGLFSKPPAPPVITRVGGPIVCPRGLESFFTRKLRVPLPAASVFSPYLRRELPPRGMGAFRSFRRRGMGQDDDLSLDYSNPVVSWDNALTTGLSTPAPTFSYSDPTLSSLTLAPAPTPLPTLSLQPGGSSLLPTTSNPSLDAFNQALTNAQAVNPALTTASVLASMGTSLATATPTQLQQATASLNAQASPGLSSWLSGSTILTGFSNGTVLFGGAGIAVLLSALLAAKKGKR